MTEPLRRLPEPRQIKAIELSAWLEWIKDLALEDQKEAGDLISELGRRVRWEAEQVEKLREDLS